MLEYLGSGKFSPADFGKTKWDGFLAQGKLRKAIVKLNRALHVFQELASSGYACEILTRGVSSVVHEAFASNP
jgi:hypothetical protein